MITVNSIYTSEFKYKRPDGSEDTILIKPVPAKWVKTLYSVARKFQGVDKNPETILDRLDEDTVSKLMDLCLVTLEVSCPEVPVELREQFAVSHFNELIGVVFSTNIRG